MSSGVNQKRGGLVEIYGASLERRIQQGNWNLVCRDAELCKQVEGLLSKGAAQDTHSQFGLDPLSVMEASLQAFPTTSGQSGLERLAKAFEVLELAALNLYLCPWRKEYKVVKLFSGMYTHLVKPALTSEQAKELFGLLGYQPTGIGEEEELRLSSIAVPADSLLQLACAFFTARVECQLLYSSAFPVGSCVQWELQLVRERKRGHSLQIAQESARRKLESTPQSSDHDMTPELDLYTAEHSEPTENDYMTAPPNYSYTPPKDTFFSKTTQLNRESDENIGKGANRCISTITYQISPNHLLSTESELSPKPLKTFDYAKQDTSAYVAQISCPSQGHDLTEVHPDIKDVPPQFKQEKTKCLKKHSCMDKSTSTVFSVCHSCQNIHDFECEDLQNCEAQRHNTQFTGCLQPPQGEGKVTVPPQRHTCLRVEDPSYVVCQTCNKAHYIVCEEVQRCEAFDHSVIPQMEKNKVEKHAASTPMDLHQCCTPTQMPSFVCLTCRVFHNYSCNEKCFEKHNIKNLSHVCTKCANREIWMFCRNCCAQYCKSCWLKQPIDCKCGRPYLSTTV